MTKRLKLGNAEMMKNMTFTLGCGSVYLGMEMNDAFKVIRNWVNEMNAFKVLGTEINYKAGWNGPVAERFHFVRANGNILAVFKFSRPVKVSEKRNEEYKDEHLYLIMVRFNFNNMFNMLRNAYKIDDDTMINWIISCGKTGVKEHKDATDLLGSIKCGDYRVITSKVLLDKLKNIDFPLYKNRTIQWEGTNSFMTSVFYDKDIATKVGYCYMLRYKVLAPIATAFDYSKERQFISELEVCIDNVYDLNKGITCS